MAVSIRTYKFNRLDALLDAVKSFALEGYDVYLVTVYTHIPVEDRIDHYELSIGQCRKKGEQECDG